MADSTITIDFDVKTQQLESDKEQINKILSAIGENTGDKMDDEFKKSADKVVDEAKQVKKDVDNELNKPTATITPKVDDSEAQKGTQKIITSLRKLPKEQKVKLDADAKKAGIDDFTTLLKRVQKTTPTEILAQAQKGEVIDYEALLNKLPKKVLTEVKLNDNASDKLRAIKKESESTETGFAHLKTIIAGSFLGGAALNGITMLVDGLKDIAVEGASASDAMDKFRSTMQLGGFGEKEIKKTSDQVMDYANKTVYGLDDIANTTAQLAANGIKNYMGLTEAAGNLNAQAGGNAETFKSVAMMLTQTAGAGKLTTENWNQLADAIPGASGVLQKAMKDAGAYTGNFRDAMANGQITADEFSNALMKLGQTDGAKKAAESTKTFEGAFGNMKAAVVDGMKNVIDAFGKDKFTGPINSLGNVIQDTFSKLTTTIKDNQKTISAITKVIGEVARTVGGVLGQAFLTAKDAIFGMGKAMKEAIDKVSEFLPFLSKADKSLGSLSKHKTAIKAVGTALGAIATGVLAFKTAEKVIKGLSTAISILSNATKIATGVQKAFNLVMSLNPIALTVAAVVALGAAFYQAYKHVKPFRDAVNNLAKVVADFAKNAWKHISDLFSKVTKIVRKIWKEIEPIVKSGMKVIRTVIELEMAIIQKSWNIAWNAIKTVFQVVWKVMEPIVKLGMGVIKGVISGTMNVISGVWKGAWNLIKNVLHGVWEIMKPIVKTALDVIADIIKIVTNAIKGNWSGVWNGIKNLFSDVWNGIKSIGSGAVNGLKDIVIGGARGIQSTWEGIWRGVSSFFGGIWDGIKGAARDGINGVIGIINSGVDAIDKVWSFFTGSKTKIPHLGKVHFAQGGVIKRHLSVINDGDGPDWKELVQTPDGGLFMSQERNWTGFLPEGSRVYSGAETKEIMNAVGVTHYATGGIVGQKATHFAGGGIVGDVIDWGKGALSNIGSWIGDKIEAIEKFLKDPVKSIKSLVFKATEGMYDSLGNFGAFAKGTWNKITDNMKSWIEKTLKKVVEEEGGSNPPGEGVERWRPVIKHAASMLHVDLKDWQINNLLKQIQTESGGNPNIVQTVWDVNMANGNPAQGLLQFIPQTFKSWAVPGHTNIHSGLDQILAAIRRLNAMDTWNYIGHGHGWATGGHVYNKQLAWIAEDGDEFVINNRKANADNLIASAIKQRAEINPNSFSAKIAHIIDSAKFSGSNGYGMAPSASQPSMNAQATQIYEVTDYSQQIEAINHKLDIIADKQVKVDGRSFAVAYEKYGSHERNQRNILDQRGLAVDVNF